MENKVLTLGSHRYPGQPCRVIVVKAPGCNA